jgi:hypothetical protein
MGTPALFRADEPETEVWAMPLKKNRPGGRRAGARKSAPKPKAVPRAKDPVAALPERPPAAPSIVSRIKGIQVGAPKVKPGSRLIEKKYRRTKPLA